MICIRLMVILIQQVAGSQEIVDGEDQIGDAYFPCFQQFLIDIHQGAGIFDLSFDIMDQRFRGVQLLHELRDLLAVLMQEKTAVMLPGSFSQRDFLIFHCPLFSIVDGN